MDPKKDLTAFSAETDSRPAIAALLDEAGLELWQAPEGFWAIRAKRPLAPVAGAPRRRRARRAA